MTTFSVLSAQLDTLATKLSDATLLAMDSQLFSAPIGQEGAAVFYGGRFGENVGLLKTASQIAGELQGYWIEETAGNQGTVYN